MKRNCHLAVFLGGILVLVPCPAPAAQAVISPEQLRADWLRQEELRERARAPQPGGQTVRPEEDARGGRLLTEGTHSASTGSPSLLQKLP